MKPLYTPEILSVWEWPEAVAVVIAKRRHPKKPSDLAEILILQSTTSSLQSGSVICVSPFSFARAKRLA